MINQIAMSTV